MENENDLFHYHTQTDDHTAYTYIHFTLQEEVMDKPMACPNI